MWSRRVFSLGVVVLVASLVAMPAAAGQWVNVSAQWCNGTCEEGHDDAACLCEYQKGQSPYSSASWNNCVGVSCCSWSSTLCSIDTPGCSCRLEDGSDPGRMRQWCFPGNSIVTCVRPDVTGSYTCSFDCTMESECVISAPNNSPNWIYINGTAGEQCTGENETGFWSWAAWWSFLTGANTCTLSQQSPWDDYPLEGEVCE